MLKKQLKKLNFIQIIFISLFIILLIYVLFLKSEIYESNSSVVIKDLSSKTTNFSGLSFLIPNSSSTQDVFVLESYLESYDELQKINKIFHLKKHYSNDEIDIVDRLMPWNTKEDFLKLYLKRLNYVYDQTTGIINIGFLHTDPKTSYAIVKQLIKDANEQLNMYNKLIAEKQLKFVKEQVENNKKALAQSIKKLENFQNKHTILDPTKTATSHFAILSNLQATLIEKRAKLNELSQYMNKNSFEIIRLKNGIINLNKTIKKIKKSLTNPNKKSLNIYIFEFERLKGMVELNKELYKQSLLQLEQLKIEVNKNSKTLLEISKPFIPEGYEYPEKFKDIITIILILLLLYGIISLIQAIIKEHID
jgi:capsular polysaccharide transport system permease protein